MSTALLLSLAAEIGAPMVEKILRGKIGQGNAEMVSEVVSRIATGAGGRPGDLDALIRDNPDAVREAIVDVETQTPEVLALYAQGLEFQMAQLEASKQDPIWFRAWRPGWMVLLGFLWVWNAVILHSFNAVFKIALPPVEWGVLVQLTALFMGLYMGGHTVKDFGSKIASAMKKV